MSSLDLASLGVLSIAAGGVAWALSHYYETRRKGLATRRTLTQTDIFKNNASFTSWTPDLQNFFAQTRVDQNLVKQAFLVSRGQAGQSGSFAALDAFMAAPPSAWTPACNDTFICMWLASGDLKYLRHLRDGQSSAHPIVSGSALWALGSLKQQYGLDI